MNPPVEDPGNRPTNRILQMLPAADCDRLLGAMVSVSLGIETVLFEPGEPIEAVYFPLDGVIALVTPLEDGATVEVATVGNEGLVGVPLVPGGSLAVRAISLVAGRSLRMEAPAFLEGLRHDGPLHRLVQNYLPALFGQISQAVACNRLHTNEERLSRLLLMSRDRVGMDEFAITHDSLSQMLGSRRATVTLSAGILEAAGLITYHGGRVTILDREGLEEVSCECYGAIKKELDRVVAPSFTRPPSRGSPAD